jgi:phospholipid/cholesterol/gamma-HCH transport system ATP-binding protein
MAAESATRDATGSGEVVLRACDLQVGFDGRILMREVSFDVHSGEIFCILGPSGSGKSTLLRVLMGLKEPHGGRVFYSGQDFWAGDEESRRGIMRGAGVLFQGGALWSSMTLAENVELVLQQHTDMNDEDICAQALLKLALTGLAGFEDYYPSEISGGMRKRAGLARALALDPEILFLDEPSAGLDPVSARMLDDLILELRATLKTTFVIVSHELRSIFAVADNCIYLDAASGRVTAGGRPAELARNPATEANALRFLNRGEGVGHEKETA